jgi:hypothetical protein
VICGGGLMEISDLSGEMVLSWNWSRVGALRLSLFFRGTGDVGKLVFFGGNLWCPFWSVI